jgi:hypothetical protein
VHSSGFFFFFPFLRARVTHFVKTGKSNCFVIKWNNYLFWKLWGSLYDDCTSKWPSICIYPKIQQCRQLDVAPIKGNLGHLFHHHFLDWILVERSNGFAALVHLNVIVAFALFVDLIFLRISSSVYLNSSVPKMWQHLSPCPSCLTCFFIF